MQTVIVTNNAYDTILLVDENDVVRSRWDATKQLVLGYVANGANASDWNTDEWPAGFAPSEQDTEEDAAELLTIAAYGQEYGRNGRIDNEERRNFWGLND